MAVSGEEYLRKEALESIAPGFETLDEVIDGMRELAEDDEELDVDPDRAEEIVRELWDHRAAYLATSPARTPTDDVRVAAAFAQLEAAGIVAWMNCGWDQDEAAHLCREAASGRGASGFVYFHAQDAVRLSEPDATLYLGFDAVAPEARPFPSRKAYDAAAVIVGRTVVDALVAQGLTVEWNGSPTERPQVTSLDWRRPLPLA